MNQGLGALSERAEIPSIFARWKLWQKIDCLGIVSKRYLYDFVERLTIDSNFPEIFEVWQNTARLCLLGIGKLYQHNIPNKM